MEALARASRWIARGSGAGLVLRACLTCKLNQLEPQHFRVLLLRRFHLPLPLAVHSCWCGRPLDQFGHHRGVFARAGILGKRGYVFESVVARICREAGGRVTTNVVLRELDFGFADDAVMVGAFVVVRTVFRCSAEPNWQFTEAARRHKERRYPELVSRLVVFGVEVGGCWSCESQGVISQLARARAQGEQPLLRHRIEQAWRCWASPELLERMGTLPWSMMWNVICWQLVLLCDT